MEIFLNPWCACLNESSIHGGWYGHTFSGLQIVVGAISTIDDAQHNGLLHRNLLVAGRVKNA